MEIIQYQGTSFESIARGALGMIILLLIAYLISSNKKQIKWKTVLMALSLQIITAVGVIKINLIKRMFEIIGNFFIRILEFTEAGTSMVLGDLNIEKHEASFALQVLPVIIFFSAFASILYYFGIIQKLVSIMAWIFTKLFGISGAESLSVAGNIFLGQTEAPLMVKPFVDKMTKSELMAVMTGGFATAAGGILAIYVSWLSDIPGIAGHLLTASVMSAPAALVMAKIIYPEVEESNTMGDVSIEIEQTTTNAMEALGNGATTGLKLAANIAAMLIAFLAFVAMINYLLSFVGTSMEDIFGFLFKPLAWTMGVPWEEAGILATLMGKKIVLTELIAYGDLQQAVTDGLSDRTAVIASYALCGFANFGSIGIQLGGIGAMAPNRRGDLARLVTKAMIGGALASWLTATIAGLLL